MLFKYLKNVVKYVLSGCNLKNLVKLLAVSNAVTMGRSQTLHPLDDKPFILKRDETGLLAVKEGASRTYPFACEFQTTYTGSLGILASIGVSDRDSCIHDAKICDETAKECTTLSSFLQFTIHSNESKITTMSSTSTITCRRRPGFYVNSRGCDYHEKECPDIGANDDVLVRCHQVVT